MPFQPGHNHGGKGKLVDGLIRKLTVQDLNEPEGKSQLLRGLRAMLKRAGEGDQDAIDWWTNRESGKAGGDDGEKGQLIQVVINGYADVQARIVDNSQGSDHDPALAVTGGTCPVVGVSSRVPDDSLPIPEISDNSIPSDENDPPGLNSVQELEVVPSTTGG